MTVDGSVFSYFYHAGLIVKIVMMMLLAASFTSWVIIFQRRSLLKGAKRHLNDFENKFWSTSDLSQLYKEIEERETPPQGLEVIFLAGFKEFIKLQKRTTIDPISSIPNVQRAMAVAQMRLADELEDHLSLLATIGSTSPFVGLFGTVWGIMTAFQALGHVSQASIAMVAPGISEALVATAMGLFAAIPAVIAYNYYNRMVSQILSRNESFQEEFSNYLYRQAQLLGSKG